MYITNNANTSNTIRQIECPPPCGYPLHIYVNLLGAIFGISCLVIYFIKKKFFLHSRSKKKKLISQIISGLGWVFLALFFLYFLKFEYKSVDNKCLSGDILLSGKIFPDILQPLYTSK